MSEKRVLVSFSQIYSRPCSFVEWVRDEKMVATDTPHYFKL
jgi:hypothetical protein